MFVSALERPHDDRPLGIQTVAYNHGGLHCVVFGWLAILTIVPGSTHACRTRGPTAGFCLAADLWMDLMEFRLSRLFSFYLSSKRILLKSFEWFFVMNFCNTQLIPVHCVPGESILCHKYAFIKKSTIFTQS